MRAPRTPWDETTLTILRRMHAAGHSDAAIAIRLGTSTTAIKNKRSKLGLVRQKHVGQEAHPERRRGAA